MTHLLLAIIYLAFISLGLPDSLLGSAWPTMYQGLGVPLSYAGIISMIISLGTIFSSVMSDRLTRALGTGRITAISVGLTAAALFGFSVSHTFPLLCLWAIPYGLGAGSVDASINNYVALHYSSRHMSWLHCMWGVGAALGPYAMAYALTHSSWNMGYRYIAVLQIGLTAILLLSIPLWKARPPQPGSQTASEKPLGPGKVLRLPGAGAILVTFFCYCALEQTTGLWASSYLVLRRGVEATAAAGYASLFFIGITLGRAVSGFLTFKWNDAQLVRIGQGVVLLGILLIMQPFARTGAVIGLVAVGLGCAPIFPSLLHATPEHFGQENSQAVMGIQMACAYVGTCLMPPLFGKLAEWAGIALYPWFLLGLLGLMLGMHTYALRRFAGHSG